MGASQHDLSLHARFERASQGASIGVVLLGAAALLGWALDLEPLKAVVPPIAMNPGGTAVASSEEGAEEELPVPVVAH